MAALTMAHMAKLDRAHSARYLTDELELKNYGHFTNAILGRTVTHFDLSTVHEGH